MIQKYDLDTHVQELNYYTLTCIKVNSIKEIFMNYTTLMVKEK